MSFTHHAHYLRLAPRRPEKRGQRWKEWQRPPEHRRTRAHPDGGDARLLPPYTHTDVLLYGCHDNRFTRSGWESVWSRVIRPHGGRKRKIFYMLVLCTKQKRHLWSDNEEAFQQMNYNVLALTFKIEFCNNLAGELCENVILHFFLLFFILKLQNEQQ